MLNDRHKSLLLGMGKVACVVLILLVYSANGAGYQIQETVSQINSGVMIRIADMVDACNRETRGSHPNIQSFVFNFWKSGCYFHSPHTKYPTLFNDILRALRLCSTQCSTSLRYTLPLLNCDGQLFPNTFSINYECAPVWQNSIVLTTTTEAAPTPSSTTLPSRNTESTSSLATLPVTPRQTTTTARTTTRPPVTTTSRPTTTRAPTTTTRATTTTTRATTTTTRATTTTTRATTTTTRAPTTTTRAATTTTRASPTTALPSIVWPQSPSSGPLLITPPPTTRTVRSTNTATESSINLREGTTTSRLLEDITTSLSLASRLRRTRLRQTSVSSLTTTTTATTTTTTEPTTTTAEPTTTTTEPTITATEPTTPTTVEEDNSGLQLVAEQQRSNTGFLYADLNAITCDSLTNLHILKLDGEGRQGHCEPDLLPANVESQLKNNTPLISQPYCLGTRIERARKLFIDYECLGEETTTENLTTTQLDTTVMNISTSAVNIVVIGNTGKASAKENGGEKKDLILILATVIPISVLLILIPIVLIVLYKRRNKVKIIMCKKSPHYGTNEEIYSDPSNAFSYSQMNSAYSNEHLEDNTLYQDPALWISRPQPGLAKFHTTSLKSTGSSYQDPSSLPCTGPPGTPSPIRDAMYSARDDPSSDVYADVDALRGDPDGKTATLPREDQNIYDMPHVEVVKPTPQPRSRRDQTPGGEDTSGLPSYSHMIVTDGQLEPHNYAIVRKSKPTESMYYELENEVELYDSPVYNSMEEMRSSSETKEGVDESK